MTQQKISNFHRKVYWSVIFTVLFLTGAFFFLLYWNNRKNGISFSETMHLLGPFLAALLLIILILGTVFLRIMYKLDNRLMQTQRILFLERERVLKQEGEQVRIKRQLTQNIAHELKTPVTGIQGYLETIISDKEMEHKVKDKFIEKAFSQCKRLSSLLRDITYLSRIDEAPEFIEKEEADIAELISGMLGDLTNQIKEKHITVHNNTENQKIISYSSTSLLYSIFRNLVENTIAYAGENVDIFINCYKEDDLFYYFSYADNGVGVADEHLTRIFERFYRLDKGRSRKLGGTGLGLAIVKNSVLFHGGQITAKKYADGGLEFVFTIKKEV